MTSWILLHGAAVIVLSLGPLGCGLATGGIGSGGAGGGGGSSANGQPSSGHGGASSSVASTSSSSGIPAESNCFDNIDNNGDGKIDCADMTCNGVAACANVPAGWSFVRATLVGDPSLPPGMCADGKTPRAVYFTQPSMAPATCTACQCGVDPQATCSAPEISCWYYDGGCNGNPSAKLQPNSTACAVFPNVPQNGSGSCKLTGPGTFNGNCPTTGGAPTKGPMWGGAVFVCDAVSSTEGCAAGQQCGPTVANADGPVCIKKDGTDSCPQGWMNAIPAFKDGSDNRDCTSCSCTGGCTGGSFVVHDLNDCTDANPPVTVNSGNCTPTPGIFDIGNAAVIATLAKPAVASCNGGQPQGQVTPTNPVQICCK